MSDLTPDEHGVGAWTITTTAEMLAHRAVVADAVAALYPKATEGREEIGPHDPTGVLPTDAGVFVECACGKNPTPKYWIEDHWTGERPEGERRVRALLAAHLPAARHSKATEGACDD